MHCKIDLVLEQRTFDRAGKQSFPPCHEIDNRFISPRLDDLRFDRQLRPFFTQRLLDHMSLRPRQLAAAGAENNDPRRLHDQYVL